MSCTFSCLDKKRCFQVFLVVSGAIGTSIETVFGSPVRFTCPEGQVFATGVEVIDTVCMPGGKWSQSYIPKCQEVMTSTKIMNQQQQHLLQSQIQYFEK